MLKCDLNIILPAIGTANVCLHFFLFLLVFQVYVIQLPL